VQDDEAAFRDLAEQTAAALGLAAAPAWESGWHTGAHLTAPNGTGWVLSWPHGHGSNGMTRITPLWPGGGSGPPGSGEIRAGITAARGPQIVAARIRQLAHPYRQALVRLAASQAQDAAQQARRDSLTAQITALIPDDDPHRPRVRSDTYGATTQVHIASAGTVKFSLGAHEIELDRFRAPANVVLAMLDAYARTPREPVQLEVGPPADYTHDLAEPPRPEPVAVTVRDTPRTAPKGGRPELVAGALRLLAGLEKESAKCCQGGNATGPEPVKIDNGGRDNPEPGSAAAISSP
jgi:hypothetical protein